mgnify:CR=1 FL=1
MPALRVGAWGFFYRGTGVQPPEMRLFPFSPLAWGTRAEGEGQSAYRASRAPSPHPPLAGVGLAARRGVGEGVGVGLGMSPGSAMRIARTASICEMGSSSTRSSP